MYITATGMVCAVGLNAASACAAMRAGIANFVELPYHDNQGEPIVGAPVPGVSFDLRRTDRLVELLSMAITDCLKGKPKESLDRIPLLVGLAEPERPCGGARRALPFIEQVQKELQMQFSPQLSRAFPKGHTSGFDALMHARELLTNRVTSSCLVCGVDSFLNAESLLWLEQTSRLKTPANSDGVIPGEAAAAVLVQLNAPEGMRRTTKISGIGSGIEAATVLSETPLRAEGLTNAGKTALTGAGLEMHDIDFRLADVTGEGYGFREQSLCLSRLLKVRRECQPLWQFADAIGDTGAASAVVQLVVAHRAYSERYAPGRQAICFSSSLAGDRAAAVLSREKAETQDVATRV